MSNPQQDIFQPITDANAMQFEHAILLNAKQVVDHFMPTPGSYPPAPQVAKAVRVIQALMTLVKAQQEVVITSEQALDPILSQLGDTKMALKEAEQRVIVLEKMRDDTEQMYHDLANQMADMEQAQHDEDHAVSS
jgi:hypothetical protein